jgi:hypothetical protein
MFVLLTWPRAGTMTRPALADPGIGGGEILGDGEYLGIIGDTIRELFARSDISGKALVIDVTGLFCVRLIEEGATPYERVFEYGSAVIGGKPNLENAVSSPRVHHVVAELTIGIGAGYTCRQSKCGKVADGSRVIRRDSVG